MIPQPRTSASGHRAHFPPALRDGSPQNRGSPQSRLKIPCPACRSQDSETPLIRAALPWDRPSMTSQHLVGETQTEMASAAKRGARALRPGRCAADPCRLRSIPAPPRGQRQGTKCGITPSTPCAGWRCSWSSACTPPWLYPARHPRRALVRPGLAHPAGLRLVLLVVDGGLESPVFHDRRVLRRPPVRFARVARVSREPGAAGAVPFLVGVVTVAPGLPGRLDLRLAALGAMHLEADPSAAVPRPGDPGRAIRHGAPLVPRIPDRDAGGLAACPVVERRRGRLRDAVPSAGRLACSGRPGGRCCWRCRRRPCSGSAGRGSGSTRRWTATIRS